VLLAVALSLVVALLPWSQASGLRVGVALAAGLGVVWWLRPWRRLGRCVQMLVDGREPGEHDWPTRGDAGRVAASLRALAQRHRQQREASAQALGRLQAVLDHAPVGIAFARNSRLELVSQHLARLFGRQVPQMTGQPTSVMHASDEDRAEFVARASTVFSQHGGFDGESRLARADGGIFWGRLRGRAVQPGEPAAGTIWIVDDISHSREEQQRLAWAAEHDALTGLMNRPGFEMRLQRMLDERKPFAALFLDLDRFKQVNDSAGHAAGDRLLVELSARIAGVVRDSDTVARLGGDEFALLMPQCPPQRAAVIAEAIRAAVESYRLDWNGSRHGVGASIGLVQGTTAFPTCAAVLAAADAACYAAKRGGRNRVVVWRAEAAAAPVLAA